MARLSAQKRRRMIGQAALKIARERGLHAVTHGDVAKRCPIPTSVSTVRHYFTCQDELQLECVVLDEGLRSVAIELGVIKA